MKGFLTLHLLFTAVVGIAGWILLNQKSDGEALIYGLAVFALNLLLMVGLVGRVFRILGFAASTGVVKLSGFRAFQVACLGLVKLAFLGASAYYGLVVLDLSPLFFLMGCIGGLAIAAATGAYAQKQSRVVGLAGA
jgi:hypothetical protein